MGLRTAEPIDLRRRWLVITAATVVMQFSYWLIVVAALDGGDQLENAGGMFALGLGIAWIPFVVLAFAGRHRNAASAVLKAMGLFLLAALPFGLLNVVVGMVAGFGLGGVAALPRDPDAHSLKWRLVAVGLATVYVIVLRDIAPDLAIMTGAIVPFFALGIVDQVTEAR
jgi:hypothetical protein